MTPQALWALFAGLVGLLYFLADWSHHQEKSFDDPPKFGIADIKEFRVRTTYCFGIAGIFACILPVALLGIAVWYTIDVGIEKHTPLSIEVVQGICIALMAIRFWFANLRAYWFVAAMRFGYNTTRRAFLVAVASYLFLVFGRWATLWHSPAAAQCKESETPPIVSSANEGSKDVM
jgi:hypothetical protein